MDKRWRKSWRNEWAKVPTTRNILRRRWDGETAGETAKKIDRIGEVVGVNGKTVLSGVVPGRLYYQYVPLQLASLGGETVRKTV